MDADDDAAEEDRRKALVALAGETAVSMGGLVVPVESMKDLAWGRISAARYVAGAILLPRNPDKALAKMVSDVAQEADHRGAGYSGYTVSTMKSVANAYAERVGLPRPYP